MAASVSVAAAAPPTPRWLAYDDPASQSHEDDNLEVEPGNSKMRSVRWGQMTERTCQWSGISGAPASAAAAVSASAPPHASQTRGAFAASVCPHRTLTFDESSLESLHVERVVCFLPECYTSFPAHLDVAAAAALTEHRSALLQSLLRDIDAADQVTSDVYSRFRLLWSLARDNPALQQGAAQLRTLRRHPNLFAPVGTHDPRALAERMQRCVLPAGDATATEAAAAAGAGAAGNSTPVSSRLQEAIQSGAVGLLPQEPFSCSLSDAPAMSLTLLGALVHAQACCTLDWNLDARSWSPATPDWQSSWRASLESSCSSVRRWLLSHLSQRLEFARFALRCHRELMPSRTMMHLLSRCLPFDWRDVAFQNSIVRTVLRDPGLGEFPPDAEHSFGFWSAVLANIEAAGVDVDDELSVCMQRLLTLKTQRALAPSAQQAHAHWTVTYRHQPDTPEESEALQQQQQHPLSDDASEIELRTCTMRMELGFSSTTGMSLWPAGFLMSDFIVQNAHIFRGRRVMELGTGIGLTSLMLQRAGADTVVCTDGDERAVENLRTNFRINGVDLAAVRDSSAALLPPGVHVDTLMWDSAERDSLVRQAAADVILSCDTIYLPEFHDALATLVRDCLALPRTDDGGSSSSGSPERVAYFTQMNRNPETFDSYTSTFARHGLRLEPVDSSALPSRFAYDRESINFHKITLQQ